MNHWLKKSNLAIPALLLIAINTFLYTPHLIYFDNSDHFSYHFIDVVPTLLLLVVITVMVCWLTLLLVPDKIFKYIAASLTAISFLLWFQSDLFVISYGVLDDSGIDFADFISRGKMELLAISLTIIFATIFTRFVLKHLTFVALIIAVSQLSIVVYQTAVEPKTKPEALELDDEFFNYSESKNIIVIILDTFGAEYFQQIIKNNPAITEQYKGFVSYTDAISNYPATKASIPSLLTGTLIDEGSSYPDYLKLSGKTGFLNTYAKQNYLVSAVGAADRFRPIFPERYISNPPIDANTLLVEQAFSLADLALFRSAPHYGKPHIYRQGNWWLTDFFTSSELPTKNPAKAVYMFDMVTQKAVINDSTPRLKYIHIRLPHPLFVLDAECNMKAEPNGSHKAVVEQSTCALNKLNTYLKKLKDLDVYNNSLIVVSSDHGARRFNDFSVTGFPSYYELKASGILLMIKGINQTTDFKQVKNPVSLLDVHDFIIDESKHEQHIDFIHSTERPFYSYQNGFNTHKGMMQGGVAYTVDANYNNPESWKLVDFYSQKCTSKKLPVNMLFQSRNHEKYCAKFGFLAPATSGSGVWSEGADSRIFVKLNFASAAKEQSVVFDLQYKPYFNSKLNPYEIHWIVNDVQVATDYIDNNKRRKTQFIVPFSVMTMQPEIEIKISIPYLENHNNASKVKRNKGIFLEYINIK